MLLIILALEIIVATRPWYSDDRPGPSWDIAAILIVLAFSAAGFGLQQWQGHKMRLAQFVTPFGEVRHTINEKLETKLDGIATLRIENGNGQVQVKRADQETVKVEVEITATADTLQAAEKLALDVDLRLQQDGQKLAFVPSLPAVTGQQNVVVNVSVTVPDRALAYEIFSQFGAVETDGLTGSLRVEDRNGPVTVNNNHGAVAVASSFGNVRVKGVEGDLSIQAGNGTTEADQVSGTAVVRSSFGRVELRNVTGRAEIEAKNGGVLANDIKGDLVITSSFGSAEIANPGRQVTVKSENGSITVVSSDAPRQRYDLQTKFGSVRVRLPKGSDIDVDASSDFGKVEMPVPASIVREGNRTTARLSIGSGGPLITLRSENGNVTVEYR
ncbi:MAG: DUF4097 family beta strand repeat-containing protein [Bacillota bacterium]